jgi:Animal haem peroxidase
MRRSAGSRVLSAAFALLNRLVPWHRLPALLGMLNLLAFREELREHNLHDTSQKGRVRGGPHGGRRDPRVLCARTVDGSFNDLAQPGMGAAGARFGRNFPVQLTRPEPEPALLEPSPRTISRRLLARDGSSRRRPSICSPRPGFSFRRTTGSATARRARATS